MVPEQAPWSVVVAAALPPEAGTLATWTLGAPGEGVPPEPPVPPDPPVPPGVPGEAVGLSAVPPEEPLATAVAPLVLPVVPEDVVPGVAAVGLAVPVGPAELPLAQVP